MALTAATKLAPHFTAGELGVTGPTVPADTVSNATRVAAWLEQTRAILGVPLRVTRGYSTPEHNVEVGGSPTSDHPNGLAADFVAVGMTPFEVYQRLVKAQETRQLAPFDQLIFYAVDSHVHVGLGAKLRGEILLRTTEGTYVQLAGAYLTKIRGYL